MLRLSLGQQRPGTNVGENQAFPAHQREELVQQLETLSLKVLSLKFESEFNIVTHAVPDGDEVTQIGKCARTAQSSFARCQIVLCYSARR